MGKAIICGTWGRFCRRRNAGAWTSIWQSLAYLDCSACIENILLGAVELGLGSCYVSGFHEKPMRKALGLPEHVRPIALLPIGYPQMEGHARPRPALETLIHQETY